MSEGAVNNQVNAQGELNLQDRHLASQSPDPLFQNTSRIHVNIENNSLTAFGLSHVPNHQPFLSLDSEIIPMQCLEKFLSLPIIKENLGSILLAILFWLISNLKHSIYVSPRITRTPSITSRNSNHSTKSGSTLSNNPNPEYVETPFSEQF